MARDVHPKVTPRAACSGAGDSPALVHQATPPDVPCHRSRLQDFDSLVGWVGWPVTGFGLLVTARTRSFNVTNRAV